MTEKTFYVTTPIFYPNANLHLGHAYVTTLADILARYHRLLGEPTYFLTGSDENTQKIIAPAEQVGKTPQQFLDDKVVGFKDLFAKLNISYDQFIRTTDQKAHWPGAIALWNKLAESGDIYKKEYEGLYCVGHEAFITEKELIDGKCPDHGTVPERIKEENYFFRLSRYTDAIREKIISDELHIMPATRKREILSLLDEGLQDVSFSRPRHSNSVGIPVPGDDSQVMYVWCDALSNYITALGYGRDDELYQKFWPVNVHVVGKDILRFHAAIWPAMLMSAGLPLPKSILVHGMILSGGKKMSKTLGNVIDPQELLEGYGTDAVRYYLARYISPFEDGEITKESFKVAYNADLANGLGNLVSRAFKMAEQYGVLESASKYLVNASPMQEAWSNFEVFNLSRGMDHIWSWIGDVDRFISTEKPFSVFKTDPEKAKSQVLNVLSQLRDIAFTLRPIMPSTSEKILVALKDSKVPENLFARKD